MGLKTVVLNSERMNYDGKLDLVKAALKAMEIDRGCEVYLQCDAPPGSGLGTSSTVMVALLIAMARWKGVTPEELTEITFANGKRLFGLE